MNSEGGWGVSSYPTSIKRSLFLGCRWANSWMMVDNFQHRSLTCFLRPYKIMYDYLRMSITNRNPICTLFDNVWQIFSSSKQKFLEEGGIQCIFDFSLILLGCSGWTSATHVFCTFYYQATKPMNSYEPYVVTKTNPLHETFEHTPNCQHVLHPRPSAPPSCAPRLEIRSCFGAWALNCRPRYPSRCSLAQVTFAERFLYERGWILV